MPKDTDPAVDVVWQYAGRLFRARMRFKGGAISGPSPVIEPITAPTTNGPGTSTISRDGYGAGVYLAPSLNFALVVGDWTVSSYVSRFCDLSVSRVKAHTVKDRHGRLCLVVVLSKQGVRVLISDVRRPVFVEEDWNKETMR